MSSQGQPDPPGSAVPTARHRCEQEIVILLDEYRALREEVTQRVAARMQLIGFAGAISALLVVSDKFTFRGPSMYVAALVLILAVVWLRGINLAIQRIGCHLRAVENRVNALAAQAWGSPERILTWETDIQARRLRVGGVPGVTGRLGGWYAN